MPVNREIARWAWAGCLFLSIVAGSGSLGANPTLSLPEMNPPAPDSPVSFAEIPTALPSIAISVENVKVNVHHAAGIDAISVSSNCPGHWNVNGNTIRQVAVSSTQKGVKLQAGPNGAQVEMNGRIYQIPQGQDGIHNLKMENGEVYINGQKLDPLPGSDIPGDCTGPDVLEVTVPDTYGGGLMLACNGSSVVQLDSWQKGALVVNLAGQSSFTSGALKQLEKTIIDVQGSGSAQISDLTTKALVANINGSGTLWVKKGSADMSNATISGTGSMMLKGLYKNLRKSVQGTGSIQVIN